MLQGLVAATYETCDNRHMPGFLESMASRCPGSEYFCTKGFGDKHFLYNFRGHQPGRQFRAEPPRRGHQCSGMRYYRHFAIFPHSARTSGTHRAMWNFIFVFVAPAVFMNSNEQAPFSTFSAAPYAVMLPGCRFKPCASPLLSAITLLLYPKQKRWFADSSLSPMQYPAYSYSFRFAL